MRFSEQFILTAIVAFIAWPWVIGLLDLAAYAVAGSQLTAIPWSGTRGAILVLWPLGTFAATVLLAGIFLA